MDFHFLISSERSGSNLITKMLDAHPLVCGPGPRHILRVIATNSFRYGNMSKEDNWIEVLHDLYRLLTSDFANWQHEFTGEELALLAEPGDLPGLLRAVFMAEAKAEGKEHLFIKELATQHLMPFLEWCFPNAKYVYLVRDPRDMALSWRNSPIHPRGLAAGARQWNGDQNSSLLAFYALQNIGRAILVHYEDLISDPQSQLERLCDFLGIKFDAAMLQFHQKASTVQLAESNEAWSNLAHEIQPKNQGKFRSALSAEEIAAIEIMCEYPMKLLGYKPVSSAEMHRAAREYGCQRLMQYEADKYELQSRPPFEHDKVQRERREDGIPLDLED